MNTTVDVFPDSDQDAIVKHFMVGFDKDDNPIEVEVNPDGSLQDVEFSDDPKGN